MWMCPSASFPFPSGERGLLRPELFTVLCPWPLTSVPPSLHHQVVSTRGVVNTYSFQSDRHLVRAHVL
jgi:hypothetical protein